MLNAISYLLGVVGSLAVAQADTKVIKVSWQPDGNAAFSQAEAQLGKLRPKYPKSNIEIEFAPGIYRFNHPALVEWASTEGGMLLITSAPSGHVIFRGSRPLHLSRTDLPADERARLPTACSNLTSTYALDAETIALYRTSIRRAFQINSPDHWLGVFHDNKPLAPSRWPANGYFAGSRNPGERNADLAITIPDDRAVAYRNEAFLWAGGYWRWNFSYEVYSASINQSSLLAISPLNTEGNPSQPIRYAVFNALADLAPTGTFVINPDRAELITCTSVKSHSIEIAAAPTLLTVQNARNVVIHGIELERTLSDTITINSSSNVLISDDFVHDSGGIGINVRGSTGVQIKQTVVSDTADEGISLLGGNRDSLSGGSDEVSGSIVMNYGQISRSYKPGIRLDGVGLAIENSLIEHGPHSAIIFSGNDHRIAGNEITDTNQDGGDAGAIYSGMDWTQRGTLINGNYFHDIGANYPSDGVSVYLDDFTSGTRVEDNIFLRVPSAIVVGGGRDNTLIRNVFAYVRGAAISMDARGKSTAFGAVANVNSTLRKNLAAMPYRGRIYSAAYPHLSNILSDDPSAPKYNQIRENIFLGTRPYQFSNISLLENVVDPANEQTLSRSISCANANYGDLKSIIGKTSKYTFPRERRADLKHMMYYDDVRREIETQSPVCPTSSLFNYR